MDLKPDVIVVDISSGVRNILSVWWQKRRKKVVVAVIQGRRMNYRYPGLRVVPWLVRLWENYILRQADIVIANSRHMADHAEKLRRSRLNIVVAYPGMDIGGIICPVSRTTQNGEPYRLLLVGECTRIKGIEYIIRALPLLGDLDFELNIAGAYVEGDPYYIELNEIIDKHGLGNRVNFKGFLDKRYLEEISSRSQIYVQPSLFEGYGIAMAEALAFGLPVVATRVAAIPEMIQDGVNGILVPPKDPRALAEAIRRLIADRELWDRVHANNLAKAGTLPSWDDFDDTLERELIPVIERMTGLKPNKN